MEHKIYSVLSASMLVATLLITPRLTVAEELDQQDNGASQVAPQLRRPGFVDILGGILLTPLLFPIKLVTCVGTQASAAIAYTGTFGVEGNYDGGTNGKDIGEVARRSCTGSWWVRPSDIARDYGR
jgi:hypothetical protein